MSKHPKKLGKSGLLLIAIVCGGLTVRAQETPASDAHPTKPDTAAQKQEGSPFAAGVGFVRLLQRKSAVFPAIATSTTVLSPRQKFQLAANNSISLSTIGAAAFSAGWDQAFNDPPGYGQGGEGYGKRFGSNMARAASVQIIGTGFLASILHQDPRFFVRENLNLQQSVKYSIYRVFITRSDSGGNVANWSGLISPMAAEGIANTYLPDANRAAGDTFERYGYDLLWKFAGNLAQQYWPTVNKKLFRKSRVAPAP